MQIGKGMLMIGKVQVEAVSNVSLVGFSDANWAWNVDDRKSTSGGSFYLGNNLVS